MDPFSPDSSYDAALAATSALHELGHVPGSHPVEQPGHVAGELLETGVDAPARLNSRRTETVWDERAVLERLDLIYRQCPTALRLLARTAASGAERSSARDLLHPGVIELCLRRDGVRADAPTGPDPRSTWAGPGPASGPRAAAPVRMLRPIGEGIE